MLIVAKDPATGEAFVVFDGRIHGYDALFCSAPYANEARPLRRYDHAPGKLRIKPGYSIDYDEEAEDYEFDENGHVILSYGTMPWDEAKSVGFDWISMEFVGDKSEFFEAELA